MGIEKPNGADLSFFQKSWFLIIANNSYENGEEAVEILTGLKISDTTLNRKVNSTDFEVTEVKRKVNEVSVDGGKIRIRSEQKGVPWYFRDYKAARVTTHHYGAYF